MHIGLYLSSSSCCSPTSSLRSRSVWKDASCTEQGIKAGRKRIKQQHKGIGISVRTVQEGSRTGAPCGESTVQKGLFAVGAQDCVGARFKEVGIRISMLCAFVAAGADSQVDGRCEMDAKRGCQARYPSDFQGRSANPHQTRAGCDPDDTNDSRKRHWPHRLSKVERWRVRAVDLLRRRWPQSHVNLSQGEPKCSTPEGMLGF